MNTTSLELSKKLYEAGLRIETEKWYADTMTDRRRGNDKLKNLHNWHLIDKDCAASRSYNGDKFVFPAYSTDELLAVLPIGMKGIGSLKIYKFSNGYEVSYASIYPFTDKSLYEALGKMCLWLLENGYHYNPETKMIEEAK